MGGCERVWECVKVYVKVCENVLRSMGVCEGKWEGVCGCSVF